MTMMNENRITQHTNRWMQGLTCSIIALCVFQLFISQFKISKLFVYQERVLLIEREHSSSVESSTFDDHESAGHHDNPQQQQDVMLNDLLELSHHHEYRRQHHYQHQGLAHIHELQQTDQLPMNQQQQQHLDEVSNSSSSSSSSRNNNNNNNRNTNTNTDINKNEKSTINHSDTGLPTVMALVDQRRIFRQGLNSTSLIRTSEAPEATSPTIPSFWTERNRWLTSQHGDMITLGNDVVLPEPVQVLQSYIRHHSVKQLDWNMNDPIALRNSLRSRKYLVAEYACPHRAGNLLSNFFNSMLIAILTNRTVLWRYEEDRDSVECDIALRRADWIPSFYGLNRTDTNNVVTRYFRANNYPFRQRDNIYEGCRDIFHAGKGMNQYRCRDAVQQSPHMVASMVKESMSNHSVVQIRGISGCLHSFIDGWEGRYDMTQSSCAEYLRLSFGEMIDDQEIDKLFKYGLDFLYGMLFRYSFQFTDDFLNGMRTSSEFDPDALSIGLHSRHTITEDTGADITTELRCVTPMLQKLIEQKQSDQKCQLLIMSDREPTNVALQSYATKLGCDGIIVEHDTSQLGSWRAEHGPFAGTGYFHDLVLVSSARNGFAGTDRSSSCLVQEIMVYDNFIHEWLPQQLHGVKSDLMTIGWQPPNSLLQMDVCHFETMDNVHKRKPHVRPIYAFATPA